MIFKITRIAKIKIYNRHESRDNLVTIKAEITNQKIT